MSYFKSLPARPNCIYCGNPVADDAWDEESHGWFSYGPACMATDPRGRYAIRMTEGAHSILYAVRLTTLRRAELMADWLSRSNPQYEGKVTFTAVDLGYGVANTCKPAGK